MTSLRLDLSNLAQRTAELKIPECILIPLVLTFKGGKCVKPVLSLFLMTRLPPFVHGHYISRLIFILTCSTVFLFCRKCYFTDIFQLLVITFASAVFPVLSFFLVRVVICKSAEALYYCKS